MERLVVCPCCQRHVKVHDKRCPFCDHANTSSTSSNARSIALVGAMVVGAGLSIASCGGQTTAPSGDASTNADGGMQGAYGPPPPLDAAADADGGMVVMYGPAPVDAGQD